MKITYKLSRIKNGVTDKKTLKDCETGRKAFQSVIVRTAWVAQKPLTPFVWVLTRFYKRTITGGVIEYDFYLLP